MKSQSVENSVNCRFLFLDDILFPYDVYEYTHQPIFLQEKWEIVRDYNDFIEWITKNGLPDFNSFDHDLADIQNNTEKTGYECAKWLVDYCLDNNLGCPKFYCHSMNPIGRDKIKGLLDQFSTFRNIFERLNFQIGRDIKNSWKNLSNTNHHAISWRYLGLLLLKINHKTKKMKKTITFLALLITFCSFSQEKSTTVASEEPAKINLVKFGTLYYDKELESDMLKIKTGAMKLSKYNPQDIPEFVAIYNSLYTKSASIVKQMPPHIAVLKKYYNLYKIQRRNMSQANISAWSKAIKAATPVRESMQKIVMDDHYGDMSFYPTLKYEGIQEDFDLYYNASWSILGF